MMLRVLQAIAVVAAVAVPAAAEPIEGQIFGTEHIRRETLMEPKLGSPAQATAGSVMWEREKVIAIRQARLLGSVQWGPLFGGGIYFVDAKFPIEPSPNGTMGCRYKDLYPNVKHCLIDADQDGVFETVQEIKNGVARPLIKPKAPVSYNIEDTTVPYAAGQFKQTLIYLGVSGQTLRLSYREFVNDMARPAFAEEVTFNLSGKYPEPVAYKDLSIDILGVGNTGIRYVVQKTGN